MGEGLMTIGMFENVDNVDTLIHGCFWREGAKSNLFWGLCFDFKVVFACRFGRLVLAGIQVMEAGLDAIPSPPCNSRNLASSSQHGRSGMFSGLRSVTQNQGEDVDILDCCIEGSGTERIKLARL
ncbi:hypothetical protein NE237_025581 [Protea cynaroides]|uniref:Uncharacterized protein n=1 Tax=Protea cynaroides TaxID=273540 RepID=A0A9Q0H3B3_9MAGN|nr:hypothetical protein NE237_025581 [Protea cynaroides]